MLGLQKYRVGRIGYLIITVIGFFMPTLSLKLILVGGIITPRVNDIGWPRWPFAAALFMVVLGSFYASIHHIKGLWIPVGATVFLLILVLSIVRGQKGENEFMRVGRSNQKRSVPEAEIFS